MAAPDVADEFAELVALVREDPLVELDVDPMLEDEVRFRALSPERQADELNRCSDSAGVIAYWTVEGGEVVRDREAEEQARTIARAWRRLDDDRRREAWTRRLQRVAAPAVALVRRRGHARRARRAAGGSSRASARSPGSREPDPPSSPLELEAAA